MSWFYWINMNMWLANGQSDQSRSQLYIVSRKVDGRYEEFQFPKIADERARHRTLASEGLLLSNAILNGQVALRSTFLPSVDTTTLYESGYLSCILLDNIQYLTTSLRSVLATQRVLEGVGVGRSGATALSATLNFLVRDMAGMAGKLIFTSYASSSFRHNVKRWKYLSEIMLTVGITIEMLAPAFGSMFLPLLCLGNICKALSKVASQACVPALQMFWAMKLTQSEEAISDIAVKSGAQRTVIGSMGMVLAGLTARWLDNGNAKKLWIGLYCGLTALHLVCNWMSLKLVNLDWLNGWRLHRLVKEFLSSIDLNSSSPKPEDVIISTPNEISKLEPILFIPQLHRSKGNPSKCPIRLGVSFNQLAKLSHASPAFLHSVLMKSNYILKVGHSGLSNTRVILVSFLSDCGNKEKAKAYLHACLVGRSMQVLDETVICNEQELIQKAECIGEQEIKKLWSIFEKCASSAGWKLDKTEFATEGYEIIRIQ